jgi:tripartite-type tricarboxylate transporter receptor subunit TctC
MLDVRRRQFLGLLGGAAAAVVAAPLVAAAPDYPNRPVTLIVNFPPGGSTDAMARIIREPLSQALGQSIIIDNRAVLAGRPGLRRSPMPSPTATRFYSRSTRR